MRPAAKSDGETCYDYVMTYVDDLIAVGVDSRSTMNALGETFKFKNNKVDQPENSLGAKLKWYDQGFSCWTITSVDYVNAAIKTIEEALKSKSYKLISKATTPMSSNFVPELDGTPELNDDDKQFYQVIIRMLR